MISITAIVTIVIIVLAFIVMSPGLNPGTTEECSTDKINFTLEENIYVEDTSSIWSQPVYDGTNVVASFEAAAGIVAQKFDLDLNFVGSTGVIASTADTNGENIADHKHIFQNDHHYVVFSISGDGGGGSLWLVKCDTDFNRIDIKKVVKDEPPTNDMLLFGDGEHVYVGKFYPEKQAAHKILKYDEDLNWVANYTEGTGENRHANGDAAIYHNGNFYFVSPDRIGPASNDRYYVVGYDKKFNVIKERTIILQDDGYLGLITGLSYYKGRFIIHHCRGPDDANPIARAVFDCNWNLLQNETVFEGDYHLPHSTIVNNSLYLGYTVEDAGFRGKLAKFILT